MDPERLSDKAVLMQAVEDQRKLAILVRRYRTPLFNFVYRFVGDRETAEDIVQETCELLPLPGPRDIPAGRAVTRTPATRGNCVADAKT